MSTSERVTRIEAPIRRRARRKTAGSIVAGFLFMAFAFVMANVYDLSEGTQGLVLGIGGLLTALFCWMKSDEFSDAAQLEVGRALVEEGHVEQGIERLKLAGDSAFDEIKDSATYTVARTYDQGGQKALAIEAYRAYLSKFEDKPGAWVPEARVRLRELGATPDVALEPSASKPTLRCPYCHDDLTVGSPEATECASCGTPHHAACLEEQGCVVLGCRQAAREQA